MRLAPWWIAALAVGACFAGELDITGKSCPCPEGWYCDTQLGCLPGDGGPGSGGSGGGGSGGGGSCPDADMDGATTCDGDCDDASPFTHPGADEVCGDLIANDCDGEPDPFSICKGLGTWVTSATGCADTNPGTQASPVCSIGQGFANASTIGNGVDVFVAEGLYVENVTLATDRTSLYGGHCCANLPCSWPRDLQNCVSSIQNIDLDGITFGASITRQTMLDGFRIVAMNGNPSSAVSIQTATPVLSHLDVVAADPSGGGESFGIVVLPGSVNDPAGTRIEQSSVELGQGGGDVTGIRFQAAGELALTRISGGGGVWVRSVHVVSTSDPVAIRESDITGGTSVFGGAAAIDVDASESVVIERNLINAGATVGSCGGGQPVWCASIALLTSSVTIRNNFVVAMTGDRSAAVLITESDGPEPAGLAIINGNVLSGGASNFPMVRAAIALRAPQPKGTLSGRIRNNVLLGGQAAANRYGIYEDSDPGATLVPELIEHNAFFGVDYAYRAWNGSTATNHDVTSLEALPFAVGNLAADCMLTGAHLAIASPCIDAGTATEAAAEDIDGEPRPQGGGIDIGADEAE